MAREKKKSEGWGGGGEGIWKIVRTPGKILVTPLTVVIYSHSHLEFKVLQPYLSKHYVKLKETTIYHEFGLKLG